MDSADLYRHWLAPLAGAPVGRVGIGFADALLVELGPGRTTLLSTEGSVWTLTGPRGLLSWRGSAAARRAATALTRARPHVVTASADPREHALRLTMTDGWDLLVVPGCDEIAAAPLWRLAGDGRNRAVYQHGMYVDAADGEDASDPPELVTEDLLAMVRDGLGRLAVLALQHRAVGEPSVSAALNEGLRLDADEMPHTIGHRELRSAYARIDRELQGLLARHQA